MVGGLRRIMKVDTVLKGIGNAAAYGFIKRLSINIE